MARIVLGVATSHSPMLALDADQWVRYAKGDLAHTGLVYPPDGISMTYDEGLAHVPAAVREKPLTPEVFERQPKAAKRFEREARAAAALDPHPTQSGLSGAG